MTSVGGFPNRLTKLDDLTRSDHSNLRKSDACFFIGEYTAHQGFNFSDTNQLIYNFKKSVDRRGLPEWKYKKKAIREAAAAFRSGLGNEFLEEVTLVPVPPSKAKDDPLYDDRLIRMLEAIRHDPPVDVREFVVQEDSTEAAHSLGVRPSPDEIEARYRIDEDLAITSPKTLAVVDDILTTGAHYRALHSILSKRFQGIPICGLFIARRVPDTTDPEELEF